MTSIVKNSPLATFPQGTHDSWQFHFFSFEAKRSFSVRLWHSNSIHHAWAWTSEVEGTQTPLVISHLTDCIYRQPDATSTMATDVNVPGSSFKFTENSPETHAGELIVVTSDSEVLRISFVPGSVHFWGVPSRPEGVFHFPNLAAKIVYNGVELNAIGYCKRYFGDYNGPWGYQFIQGIARDGAKSVWTADATFGDDEYNYFKIYNAVDDTTAQGTPSDTYHNNLRAFWKTSASTSEIDLTEASKVEFFLKSADQHSKLVERFGTVEMKKDGLTVWRGYGFSEKCFGTVG